MTFHASLYLVAITASVTLSTLSHFVSRSNIFSPCFPLLRFLSILPVVQVDNILARYLNNIFTKKCHACVTIAPVEIVQIELFFACLFFCLFVVVFFFFFFFFFFFWRYFILDLVTHTTGRNLALKSLATMSSTFGKWRALNAVDGELAIMDNFTDQERTCAHTNMQSGVRFWQLNLPTVVDAVQINIFNRVNHQSGGCD